MKWTGATTGTVHSRLDSSAVAPGRIAGESRFFEGNFPESALEHDRKGVELAEAAVPYGEMRLEQDFRAVDYDFWAVEHAEARRNLGRSQVPYGEMRLEQDFRAVDYDFWAVEQARDGLEQSDFNDLRDTVLSPRVVYNALPRLGRQPAVACLAAGAGTGTGWTMGLGFPERSS